MEIKPYRIEQHGSQYCVVNADTGETVPGGCHPTREEAEAHMQALYANVEDAAKGKKPVMNGATEHKTVPAFFIKATDQGVVEAIVSVMGIIDLGGDVIYNGAYTKTIQERMKKIRVLDNHQTTSTRNAIARPIFLQEIPRDQLPAELVKEFPMATGGLFTQSQYMLDDEDSLAVFRRIKSDFINEYSIGFDIIRQTYDKVNDESGVEVVVRGLREIRLWEYSPVLWGMNQATTTVGAKGHDQEVIIVNTVKGAAPASYRDCLPEDAARCASCLFYKTLDKGTGHCEKFDFVAARTMVCDAYKPGEAMDKNVQPSQRREYTPDGPQKRLGDHLKAKVYDKYMAMCNGFYADGYTSESEHRTMCDAGMKLLDAVGSGMTPDCAMRPYGVGFDMFDLFFSNEGGEGEKSLIVKGLRASIQAKAGRVLSTRNETRLQEAADIILSVLADAKKEPPAEETPDNSEGAQPNAEPPAGGTHEDDAKRLLWQIDLLEFELME